MHNTMRPRWRLMFAAVLSAGLAACSQSLPTDQLPQIVKPADNALTPAEQKAAIQEMTRRRDEQQAEAEKVAPKPK